MDFGVYNYEDYGWIVLLEESDLDGPLDDLCDGGWPFTLPPDYVAGDAAYVIHDELINIMEALQEQYPELGLVISEPITRPDRP